MHLMLLFLFFSPHKKTGCSKVEVYVNQNTNRPNLVPRSHSVTGNVRSGKVRFPECSVPARPEIRAFLSLRMFVLSVVILGDLAE